MTVGDYFLSTSPFTSGNNIQKISQLARCINLNMVSSSTFFRVQKHYTLPVIRDFWKEIQMKNIERTKAQMSPLNVKGMKYCIVPFLLIDFERIKYFKIKPVV